MGGVFFATMGTMNNAPALHILTSRTASRFGYCDMIAALSPDKKFWSAASATGPVADMFTVRDELYVGAILRMGYNHRTGEYDAWTVKVKRINRKSVTVTDIHTGTDHRIEL